MPSLTRIPKNLKRILLWGVLPCTGVLILAISVGMLWINSNSGKNWIQAQVNAAIPGTLAIGRHHLSLFSPALSLEEVTLRDTEGKALAGFLRFSIRIAVLPLLKKEVRVMDLTLTDPWADLVMDDEGLTLVGALVAPSDDKTPEEPDDGEFSLPVNINCQKLYIGKGRITFDIPADDLHASVNGLTITADGNFAARKGHLEIDVDQVDFKQADMAPHPIHIRLKTQMDGKTFSVSNCSITTGQTALTLTASADDVETGDPDLSGQLTLESDLAELAAVLGLGSDYTGILKAAFSIKGRASNPNADFTASMAQGRVSGWTMDQADLDIHLKDRQITLGPVVWKLAGGTIRLDGTADLRDAFPAGFLSADRYLDKAVYALALNPVIPRIKPWLAPVISITGGLEGHLSFFGKGIDPQTADARLSLEVKGKEILAPGMTHPLQNMNLFLNAQLTDGSLTLSRLEGATDDLSFDGKGHFQMPDPEKPDQSLGAAFSLHTEDISRTLAMLGLPEAKGAAHITLDADGSLSHPTASVTVKTQNLSADAYTVGDLTLVARMGSDGIVHLERLGLVNKDAKIEGSGRFRLRMDHGDLDPDFDTLLDLALSRVSLSAFMKTPPVDGRFDSKLHVSGPLTDLAGQLTLFGSGIQKDTFAIGDLTARLRLKKGALHVDQFLLKNGASTVTLAGTSQVLVPGTIEPTKDPTFDLAAKTNQFDPAAFTPMVKGLLSLDAALSGSVSDPLGKVALTGTGLDVAGQPLSAVNLDARFKDKKIWLDTLTISVTDDEAVSASGWMELDKRFSLQLATPGIDLSHIAPLQAQVAAKGLLKMDLRAQGTLAAPSADGNLLLSGIRFNDVEMKDIRLDLSLHDQVARITGDLNFLLDARYHLDKGDFDASLQFDRTDTAPWFQILGRPEINGTFSGQINASGNANHPADASAKVDIRDLALFFMKQPLVSADRIALGLSDKTLSIPEMNLSLLSAGHLRLSGDARISKENPADSNINASIDARLPVSAASLFSTELTGARGALVLEGRVAGKISQPSVSAKLDLDQISMTLPVLGQKLHNLTGSINATDSAILVDAVKGRLDSGSFKMGGKVAHNNFAPTDINLTLDASALPIEVPDTLSALVNTSIRVRGKNGAATVRGDVVLLEGSFYRDIKLNLLKMATTRQRAVSPASAPASLPYFDTVTLNIGVSHRQPFLVENNLASMEINPDLKIGGTLAAPVVSGRAQISNGTVYFQKKPFAIKKGIIDFVNPYKTVPEINIESTAVIRERTITLTLEGPPDNFKLKLASVPEETDSDILSLILFGRIARELTSGGGSQQSTAQMMAEMIADTFGDDIKERTGIDILQVNASGNSGDETDMTVTVGKHLSRRMTVKYAVESKNGDVTQRAIAEYKLLENFLLSGFQDTEGVYGTELVFRVEFR
ncbi:translocation/assembly module TamB domain-containing protein [Desulfosarcina sp. OttesenSCG-928-A07]|nr:translocation/assembly module TamB domain-containing protein [Desulfosarcina sp. OttesenSCG-928-G17]MDL2328285.1 translocation/assembly module TamB domain-containing protein [Desulfosarcina sp. OttesenSCG-928-A07]